MIQFNRYEDRNVVDSDLLTSIQDKSDKTKMLQCYASHEGIPQQVRFLSMHAKSIKKLVNVYFFRILSFCAPVHMFAWLAGEAQKHVPDI